MKQTTPYEEIINEEHRHAIRMKNMYEKYGVKKVVDLIDEIKLKMEKIEKMNKKFRENLFPLLCEMTDGDRTTIAKKFTLREDSLYKYSSSNTIKPINFIRYSNKGRYLDKCKRGRVKNRNPNPYDYVSRNISDYGIANGTGEKLETFVKMIDKYREELIAPVNGFKTLISSDYAYKIKESTVIEDKKVYSGSSAAVLETNDLDLVHIFKRTYKDRNLKIMFFEELEVENNEVLIDEDNFVFGVDEETAKCEKYLLQDEDRIGKTVEILENSLHYVDYISEIHEELLDDMDDRFAVERISREI